MDKIVIQGGKKLSGEVNISTAKNSVLPIIAASILANDSVSINKLPMLEDVFTICNVMKQLGFDLNIDKNKNKLIIPPLQKQPLIPDEDLVKKMRASFLIMGPMIAKYGEFKLARPGGCNIGTRPIGLHLKGLEALGANVSKCGSGFVCVEAKKLIGNKVYLDFPSVGATENTIMAATLAKGTTIIENAAQEPEISDLINFLNSMGAKIYSEKPGEVIIDGVDSLSSTEYTPIYDRIEAGTFMAAASITGSEIKIKGVNKDHCSAIISKLSESGTKFIDIKGEPDSIIVKGGDIIKPTNVNTMPYPGYPTDMQSQMMSLLSIAKGSSIITETVFENRFMNVDELRRMGAEIQVEGRSAFIEGVDELTGCEVRATDLRAGAALILAGLVARGKTTVTDIYHIDRGYVEIENKFKALGAEIYREH
ncbi:UDP-N-acetylglucosamine 1-carboxyvinyltransferase [Clostridium sp. B9]|uniref:UDP-N-acetylglucosamine 1-carboxyvinyltransferase n=1 Tax=Clostridium sp. B9 TaxID=3423224 RepID=UPI003D2F283E